MFSYDRMLDMKGNTAVYLLYTHARISTLLSRVEDQDLMLPNSEKFFKNEKERALAVAILKLPDAMHAVVQVHFQ
jgi:arginyl-tRNA synthetase